MSRQRRALAALLLVAVLIVGGLLAELTKVEPIARMVSGYGSDGYPYAAP